jgi:hypothetical protein
MQTYSIPIAPAPLVEPLRRSFRLTFDHGVEMTVTLTLSRVPDDPDHVSGAIAIVSETRVQDHVLAE